MSRLPRLPRSRGASKADGSDSPADAPAGEPVVRRRTFDESAHKYSPDPRTDDGGGSGVKHTLNGAAHKLSAWPVTVTPSARERVDDKTGEKTPVEDHERDVIAHAGKLVLALGALGVVYGDLGTSPLYTMQVLFNEHSQAVHPTPEGVFGVISLIFWALVIIVSAKYACLIMRVHNRGDGGVMALAALVERRRIGRTAVLVTLGIFGAGLFFGDGMITPAISVTSAVEGLNVATPGLEHLVVPIALAILACLFAIQKRGTGAVGWLFGPIIVIWFAIIGTLGLIKVIGHPAVLQALSPSWGARFLANHGVAAYLALGGVVLALTGAEALYADRGHFGAKPIRLTWFGIVFPCVLLSYLGQGALILDHHDAIRNPFYLLAPSWGQLPMVILATMATIIASQAAITGSFSMARQAVQLGFLPRLKITHTSKLEGQIYVPLVSWGLAAGVATLVLVFQHSSKLANIYGVAVTGTFVLDSILFLAVARGIWRTAWWKLFLVGAAFLIVEVAFFSANVSKVTHGAWIPLCIGLVTAVIMVTWRRGRMIVTDNRTEEEGSLQDFLYALRMADPPVQRVRKVAIYLSPGRDTTPLAMKADVEHHHVFHEKVLIVSIEPVSVPYVDPPDRFELTTLGSGLFKIIHIALRTGYQDRTNVPAALALARKRGLLERNLDLEHASYFISRITITPDRSPGMARWRKKLFVALARNAQSPIDHFGLPIERTLMVGSQISL